MKKSINIEQVMFILKKILKHQNHEEIPLHAPIFRGNEWLYVKDCLDEGWVSSSGKYVEKFEEMLAQYTGVKYAIALVNGTAALHLCLKLAGIKQGDEVLTPALTFVATVNAIKYCGASPHFIDSDEKSLGINPDKLSDYLKEIAVIRNGGCYNKKTNRPIKAVIAVHTFGHPVDLDPIQEICKKYHLKLIEDAAESLGSFYKKKHTGNWGLLAAISFNGNKIVTTGGGGAILTQDIQLAKLAKHLSTTAKIPHKWNYYHDQIGYNYRMPNVNAAIGCAQLEQIEKLIYAKRKLAHIYHEEFSHIKGLTIFKEPNYACSNYWLNVLLLDEKYASQRDCLLEMTHEHGILTRPAWMLMNKLPMFQNCPQMDLSIATSLERRIINIPSSATLGGFND